jgi:hypothetical protein
MLTAAITRASSGPTEPATNILPGHFGATGTPLLNGGYDAAANLGNGEVLFLGGGTYGDRAEVYVPSGADSGDFVSTGSLVAGRRGPLAALLPNGKVLVVGGNPDVFGCVGWWSLEVEIYDPGTGPANGHFVSLNPLPIDPLDPANSPLHGTGYTNLTRLADGRILLSGGQSCDQTQTVCNPASEIYDSSVGPNGTFTPTSATIPFGQGSTATLLPNGQVLFAGGEIETATTAPVPSSAAGLYDPVADTFAATGSMIVARDGATAVLLPTKGVLISGGRDNSNSIVASAEIYDPGTAAFHPTAHPMTTARLGHTATLLADGQHVLIVGGQAAAWLATAELYDSDADTFTSTGSMTVARSAFTSTLLVGGPVLVVGNSDLAPGYTADLYMP